MKKHIKNAAGALLMVAAIVTACLAFQDAQEDPFADALGNWPLLALTAVLAFSGVALVDTRAAQTTSVVFTVRPIEGTALDRHGARNGVTRKVRKTVTLPRGGQVRIMESDANFRRRINRSLTGHAWDAAWANQKERNTGHGSGYE